MRGSPVASMEAWDVVREGLMDWVGQRTPPKGSSSKLNFTSLCFSTTLRILTASAVTLSQSQCMFLSVEHLTTYFGTAVITCKTLR